MMVDPLYQILLVGLEGYELTEREKKFLSKYSPGGVIIFSRNVQSAKQLNDLCRSVVDHCEIPPFISIDQEGGIVDRLRPIVSSSLAATELMEFGSLAKIEEFGRISGDILRTLGFNLNFAPVTDLWLNESDNALQKRYWGRNSSEVIANAGAYLDGLEASGTLGCLKHFPGLGRAEVDSHFDLPVSDIDLETLKENDLLPFVKLHERVVFVMVAHCHFPAVNNSDPVPASVSPEIYELLREVVGFRGIAITDDLGMAGISTVFSPREQIVLALNAGADMLPFCNDFEIINSSSSMLKKIRADKSVSKERLSNAIDRILGVKSSLPPVSCVESIDAGIQPLESRMKKLYEHVMSDGF